MSLPLSKEHFLLYAGILCGQLSSATLRQEVLELLRGNEMIRATVERLAAILTALCQEI